MGVDSAVEIYNRALRLVGAEPIASIDDTSRAGSVLRTMYPSVLKHCLSAASWSFATNRMQPAELSIEKNLTPYDHGYNIQTDPPLIRIVELLDPSTHEKVTIPWIVEGYVLYTDYLNPVVKYIEYVDDTEKYPDSFIDYLSYVLAYEISYPLRGESRNDLYQMSERLLGQAIKMDRFRRSKEKWLDVNYARHR